HQQQLPESIFTDRPDAPPPLVAICRRMMEKSPENRYQSAAEVQHALTAWLESEAVFGKTGKLPATLQQYLGSATREYRDPGGSKANLISGSTPDLPAQPPVAGLSAAWRDTESQLGLPTVKISSHLFQSPSESSRALPPGSDVLPPGAAASGVIGGDSGAHRL